MAIILEQPGLPAAPHASFDREALRESVYPEFKDKVMSYVRGKVNDLHTAEDLVSTVFLKVFERFDSYDPERASLSTWIYTITHNVVIDYYRSRRMYTELTEFTDGSFEEFVEGIADEDDAPDEEMLDALADALSRLKPKERDLIVLHYYQKLTLKDIAVKMGMSYVNAKVIHAKALSRMRDMMP